LVEGARAARRLDDLGAPTWREGLERLVDSLRSDARLNATGELIMGAQITRSLTNRLDVEHWHQTHPALAHRAVERPLFIVGLPRTGTTLLSYLLDADPANRSLLRGEAFASVPPLTAATLRTDPRIAQADEEQEALYQAAPEFKAIHHETGAGPTECITLLGQDFRSVHWETMANIPTYGTWALSCDMRPAYRWHERVLQVLQSEAPGRWCLKSPLHNLALDALVSVYPDARFVVTHRDPATVVASLCRLVSVLSGLGTDHDFDAYIGQRWLELLGRSVDDAMAFRRRQGDDRFLDLPYALLTDEPLAAVASIYTWMGWPFDVTAEEAMRAYIDANPKGRHGTHRYALDDFALSPRQVDDRFTAYRDRFRDLLA
jgi:hypothetical protein